MKKRVYIFIIIALASGWLGKGIDLILTDQPPGQSLGSLLWLIIPFITAIILTLVHKSDWKAMGFKPRFKGNLKWYVVAFLVFPVIAGILLIVGISVGVVDLTKFEFSSFMSTLLLWFVGNFFRTILEEGPWRGFLTERLIKLNINDWLIYLITGLVWSTWHIPYYLFFYDSSNAWGMILSSYILLLCWSILFTEMYRITRSIWPCVLLHATLNAIQYSMLGDNLVMSKKWDLLFSPTGGIIACILCLGAGLIVRQYRIKKDSRN